MAGHKFGREFSTRVCVGEPRQDRLLLRNVDRVRPTVPRIADVELTMP